MRRIGQTKIVTARKNYGCDACTWVTESDVLWDAGFLSTLSFSEKRELVKARRNGWRILKGERCVVQTLVSCDSRIILTWRAIPEIHDFNIRHDMYIDAETC